jgi:glucose-6-phosphate-specific signal transduction histidine kinase
MRLGAQAWQSAAQAGIEIGVVAAAWTLLFWFNGWLFASFAVSKYVSWIFLPAAIRVLAVMVADWRGVCGLFLGAMITSGPILDLQPERAVLIALLSACVPYIAVVISTRYLKLNNRLDSITAKQLIGISVAGALCSALLHSVYYAATDESARFIQTFVPMFVGDMLGTAIVLAAASVVLKASRKYVRN